MVPVIRKQGQKPIIVNTSSVNGLGGASGASLYATAKAGVLALTMSAAQEYAKDGIRVNASVAGGFDTDMLRSAVKQIVGDEPVKLQKASRGMPTVFPLGVLEIHSKRLKRLFGYVAALLRR